MKLRNYETKRSLKRKHKDAENVIKALRKNVNNLQVDLEMEKSVSESYKRECERLNQILDVFLGNPKKIASGSE